MVLLTNKVDTYRQKNYLLVSGISKGIVVDVSNYMIAAYSQEDKIPKILREMQIPCDRRYT